MSERERGWVKQHKAGGLRHFGWGLFVLFSELRSTDAALNFDRTRHVETGVDGPRDDFEALVGELPTQALFLAERKRGSLVRLPELALELSTRLAAFELQSLRGLGELLHLNILKNIPDSIKKKLMLDALHSSPEHSPIRQASCENAYYGENTPRGGILGLMETPTFSQLESPRPRPRPLNHEFNLDDREDWNSGSRE